MIFYSRIINPFKILLINIIEWLLKFLYSIVKFIIFIFFIFYIIEIYKNFKMSARVVTKTKYVHVYDFKYFNELIHLGVFVPTIEITSHDRGLKTTMYKLSVINKMVSDTCKMEVLWILGDHLTDSISFRQPTSNFDKNNLVCTWDDNDVSIEYKAEVQKTLDMWYHLIRASQLPGETIQDNIPELAVHQELKWAWGKTKSIEDYCKNFDPETLNHVFTPGVGYVNPTKAGISLSLCSYPVKNEAGKKKTATRRLRNTSEDVTHEETKTTGKRTRSASGKLTENATSEEDTEIDVVEREDLENIT